MGMRKDRMSSAIAAFDSGWFELEDESHNHSVPAGAESHFKIVFVSTKFVGVSRVERQRMLMTLFKDEFSSGLHALTMRLLTPEEWERETGREFVSPKCASKSGKQEI